MRGHVFHTTVVALLLKLLLSGCVYDHLFPAPRSPITVGDHISRTALTARMGQPLRTVRLEGIEYFRFREAIVALANDIVVRTWPTSKSQHVYDIEIDAMARRHDPGSVFLIPTPPIKPGSLEFQEATRFLEPVLKATGYSVTKSPETAAYVVAVDFGVREPREWTETSYRPLITYVPGQSGTFTATCFGCPEVSGSYVAQGTLSTQYLPTQQRRRTYLRFLKLSAVDADPLREGRESSEAWSVDVHSEGPSGDLRLLLPIMIAAAWPRIAANSAHQVAARYNDTSVEVVAVRHAGTREQ